MRIDLAFTSAGLHACGGSMPHAAAGIFSLFVLVFATFPVLAADLKVRVFERGGTEPLADSAVCLGTPANLSQFGTDWTDSEGYVVFTDIPRAPVVVTVSRPGYMGVRQPLVITNTNRFLVMSLPSGGGGPACTTDREVSRPGSGDLSISVFRINRGKATSTSRSVLLDSRVEGRVTHYRAAESPDFSGTDWKIYSSEAEFMLTPGNGTKVVYFQVRRYSNIDGADLQTVSTVVKDSILLQ